MLTLISRLDIDNIKRRKERRKRRRKAGGRNSAIECGGPSPAVSPRVIDKLRLPTQEVLGEKRLANLS